MLEEKVEQRDTVPYSKKTQGIIVQSSGDSKAAEVSQTKRNKYCLIWQTL